MSVYKRGGTWWVRFQWHGKEIRRSARTTVKAEALKYEHTLREELNRIWRGGAPRRKYREAAERFIEEYLPTMKLKAAQRYLCSARQVHNHFEGLYLDEIKKSTIADYVSYRKKPKVTESGKVAKVTDATIRRDLAYLSILFSCAVDWDWMDNNPVKLFNKRSLKEAEARVRYLTKMEYINLLKSADVDIRSYVIFAKETGLRFSEQFNLKWKHTYLEEKQVMAVDTKSGRDRVVPLSDEALAQILAQPRYIDSPYVFCRKGGAKHTYDTIKERFKKALKEARIRDFTWHDLRHTFASWARKGWHPFQEEKKMPLDILQKWMGHSTIQITMRYAHLDIDDLHASIEVRTKQGTDATEILKVYDGGKVK